MSVAARRRTGFGHQHDADIDTADVAREAVRAGGLLTGGADACVWTRRVLPALHGKKDGLRMMRLGGPNNATNNALLRRLFADLTAAYRGARIPEAEVPVDDQSLLRFFYAADQRPGSQRVVNEVHRRLTAPPSPAAAAAPVAEAVPQGSDVDSAPAPRKKKRFGSESRLSRVNPHKTGFRHYYVNSAEIAREAVRAGGLLAGGADACVWTRRVMPSIRGKKDGLRLVKVDRIHNKVNNDILRRLFADLVAAYRGDVPADDNDDDRGLLRFYADQRPGSQRMVNEVHRRLTTTTTPV